MASTLIRKPRPVPALDFEKAWWGAGFQRIAGVDEAGRGALAGPLVAAAVILPRDESVIARELAGLDDSKVLSAVNRERLFDVLNEVAIAIGVGIVAPDELDELRLTAANRIAMERAVWNLPVDADALLIDAFMLDSDLPQHCLIDGDALCLSISAASVIAKVTRDRIMVEAHAVDARFGFDRHKGYGAPAHLDALERHGPCAMHRRSFAPVARCGR
jgi:ribonuclease HII